MKILWIYKYSASYNFDKWFHLEYVRWMKRNGIDIVAYGPEIHEAYPDLVEINWSPDIKWEDLISKLKTDVAILNTKSRMFAYYSPHANRAEGCILPRGFETSKAIPKIVIEEDYHYEKNDDWYFDVGIDLLLQRHYSQFLRKGKVKNGWLPFSVDIDIFKPTGQTRKNKLCFVGHASAAYPDRILFCSILKQNGLLDSFEGKQKINDEYIRCLQQYVSFLSGSSAYDITAAKNFEIMSSGGLLITDKFSGIDLLFPENCYCSIKKDGTDLIKKAKKILSDNQYVSQIVQNGLNCIKEKHSNKVRTDELLSIIKGLL